MYMFEDKFELVSQLAFLCRESGYEVKSVDAINLDSLYTNTTNLLNHMNFVDNDVTEVFRSYYNVAKHFSTIQRCLNKDKYLECFKATYKKNKKIKIQTDINDVRCNLYVTNVYSLKSDKYVAHGLMLEDKGHVCNFINTSFHKIKPDYDSAYYVNTKKNTVYGVSGNKVCEVEWDDEGDICFDQDTRFEVYVLNKDASIYCLYDREYINSLKDGKEPEPEKAFAIFCCNVPDENTNLGFSCFVFDWEKCNEDDFELLCCMGACMIAAFENAMKALR